MPTGFGPSGALSSPVPPVVACSMQHGVPVATTGRVAARRAVGHKTDKSRGASPAIERQEADDGQL